MASNRLFTNISNCSVCFLCFLQKPIEIREVFLPDPVYNASREKNVIDLYRTSMKFGCPVVVLYSPAAGQAPGNGCLLLPDKYSRE